MSEANPPAEPQQPPPQAPPGWQQPGPPPPQAWPAPPGQPYGYAPAPPAYAGVQAGPGGTAFDPETGLYLPAGTQLAPVGRRIGAWFLSIVLAIVTLGIGYIVWGLIAWSKGRTPALQVLGMRVYHPDSNAVPGFWRMALREIVGRIADGILSLITLLTSFILFVATKRRQSLHDIIASTVVLHDPNKVLG